MAVIDDYLELRPERLAEIRGAAAAGRLTLGPWYTLPDEHLVSGECLLRNLELGLARARRLGEPLAVGYLPDQFGHCAQMPQLLRRAGLSVAVLWRGVPPQVDSPVFRWEALDGSSVEVLHLRWGYGHGREIPLEPRRLACRLDQEVRRQQERNPEGPWLVMNGDDHLPVPLGLAAALESAGLERRARISSLEDYLAVRPPARGTVRGELHSAAQSFVLKGTLSARFPLKLQHAALERRLERYLEPAWTLSGRPWPRRELDYCWRQLILNSAHDSICGCSIDQVHEQGLERLARAERLAQQLWARLGVGEGLFNPSPFERRGVPALGAGRGEIPEAEPVPLDGLGLLLEDTSDRGDEYTYQGPADGLPERRPPLPAEIQATRFGDEPFSRLAITVDNRRQDHRLRLLVPAETAAGCWAGTAFGAVHRDRRAPGSEPGLEYDLRTEPARGWVQAGGTAVLLAGPIEYELLEGWIAVTLLRCVGWLSLGDLENRPGHAGPQRKTPAAQLPGVHHFEVAVLEGAAAWRETARWAEVFAHPLVPAPAAPLAEFKAFAGPNRMLSALRRQGGVAQLRTYELEKFRVEDEELAL